MERPGHSSLVLYIRAQCGLCARLERLLEVHLQPAALEQMLIVTIDGNLELESRFGFRVPVLEADGEIILEGAPGEDAVQRALRDRCT